MGADYSYYVKTIETYACTFLTVNILAIGRVGGIKNGQKNSDVFYGWPFGRVSLPANLIDPVIWPPFVPFAVR